MAQDDDHHSPGKVRSSTSRAVLAVRAVEQVEPSGRGAKGAKGACGAGSLFGRPGSKASGPSPLRRRSWCRGWSRWAAAQADSPLTCLAVERRQLSAATHGRGVAAVAAGGRGRSRPATSSCRPDPCHAKPSRARAAPVAETQQAGMGRATLPGAKALWQGPPRSRRLPSTNWRQRGDAQKR